jgi:NADH:ubiquinone oxidoreductase subunit C
MTNLELQNTISTWSPSLTFTEEASEFLTVNVPKEEWYEIAKKLKFSAELLFDYLFCETGIDYVTELGVIYHLRSTVFGHEMVVKVNTSDRENANIDTVCDIWRTAELHEREIHDLFGIEFNNHPNMQVLILPEGWEGFPLRKDYNDPVNMIIR